MGTVDASVLLPSPSGGGAGGEGANGGTVEVTGRSLLQAGAIHADGAAGDGGSVTLAASGALIQTAVGEITANAAGQGGAIKLTGGSAAFLSGTVSANGENGGQITATAPQLTLAAATVKADGTAQGHGGTLLLGGDAHGTNPTIANAVHTLVNPSTTLSAQGRQGKIVVWADHSTGYYGSAKTGPEGFIEVSGKQTLNYGGQADAGADGNVLLDPTNLIIDASAPAMFYLDLANPNPAANEQHGSGGEVALSTGNIVVATPKDTFGGAAAGAVYLYNGGTGALLSTLVGGAANDNVGNYGITALSNGNYVVRSNFWDNGAVINAGAVTWGNGTTGISGAVSSANSLVGSRASDQVGNNGVTALSNGNYVVNSYIWDNGTATDVGAATWGSGTSGVSGAVSSLNSLVGSTASDFVGNYGITALSNGNYVVSSSSWANGAVAYAGAVTWGNGATGISGAVSSANSLVGSAASDFVGNSGITALSNGNYVVGSNIWDNGTAINVGAVTWGSGTTGVSGAVSSLNSLVGSTASDFVGNYGITALSNGNYVVRSVSWDNGAAADAGAATWGNGTGGVSGAVSSSNSLVGSTANDNVGNAVTALSNGNYVVGSGIWDNGAAINAGAATWGSGTGGVSGAVSSANSLVGSAANDIVGNAVTALSNGNYVVNSDNWDNGTATDAGAATWGNGASGVSGAVSSANSLVGGAAYEYVGNAVTALSNGNYVVGSTGWNIGVGAATWGSGATGISGAVSSANSLVGSTAYDFVGSYGITALSNGNYVVNSHVWDNGLVTDVGAATWGNGASGTIGAVSSANSLVGRRANDYVGNGAVTALGNGNYLVRSNYWDIGTSTNVGAVWLVADPSNLATLVNNSLGNTTLSPTALSGAAVAGSTVTLQASNNITVNSAISVAGRLNLVAGNALTLNAGLTSTATGDALQLAGLSFTNNVGASALSTPNGRWLVWSGTPANDTGGGLTASFTQKGATYGSTTPSGSGNGFLYTMAPDPAPTPTPTPASASAPVTDPAPSQESSRQPELVRNVTSQLTANLTSPSGNNQPGTPDQSSFTKNTQESGSGQGTEENSSSPKYGNDLGGNTTMKIGENGPTIKVLDGGVKLPGSQQPNEKDSDEI